MKRVFSVVAVMALLGLAPLAGLADDVRPPGECASTATDPTDPESIAQFDEDEPYRGSVCISDGDADNGNEFYLGGDASQPCGKIEVMGEVIIEGGNQDPDEYCH